MLVFDIMFIMASTLAAARSSASFAAASLFLLTLGIWEFGGWWLRPALNDLGGNTELLDGGLMRAALCARLEVSKCSPDLSFDILLITSWTFDLA
jgi:hypothetical protein